MAQRRALMVDDATLFLAMEQAKHNGLLIMVYEKRRRDR